MAFVHGRGIAAIEGKEGEEGEIEIEIGRRDSKGCPPISAAHTRGALTPYPGLRTHALAVLTLPGMENQHPLGVG